jgi:hypothetical protein
MMFNSFDNVEIVPSNAEKAIDFYLDKAHLIAFEFYHPFGGSCPSLDGGFETMFELHTRNGEIMKVER